MASRKPLSLRQEGIMDFIRKYLGENRFPPSIREIGKAVGISSARLPEPGEGGLARIAFVRQRP
jgi:repressor LexA